MNWRACQCGSRKLQVWDSLAKGKHDSFDRKILGNNDPEKGEDRSGAAFRVQNPDFILGDLSAVV